MPEARPNMWPFEVEGRQRLPLRLTGPVLTLLLVFLLEAISRAGISAPNQGALLTLTVIAAAFIGGLASGAASVAIAVGYSLTVIAGPRGLQDFDPRDPRVAAIVLIMPAVAAFVLYLRHLSLRAVSAALSFERAAATATTRLETERNRLAASEERFRTIFHASPVAMLLLRPTDHVVLDANTAVCDFLDLPREDVVGHTADLLSTVTPPPGADDLARLAATGRLTGAATLTGPTGVAKSFDAYLVRVEIGGETAVLGTYVDTTDRGRIESLQAAAIASHGELDRQREEFLSLLAHELRTPVASIELLAQGIRDAGVPDAVRGRASALAVEARRLRGLAEDLLAIGRLEAGILEPRRSACDLRQVVQRTLEHVDAPRLDVRLGGAPVTVEADADQVGQIVDNLVSNAMKYSPESEAVVVEVAAVDGRATVRVRDRGIGLDPADVGSLFRKYGRIQRDGSPNAPGAGLGLYLAWRLAEANGGAVDAWSAGRGRGSTFTLSLPLAA